MLFLNQVCGCSSVVERHVANVNVEGSTPFTRFKKDPVPIGAGSFLLVPNPDIPASCSTLAPSLFMGAALIG